MTPNLDLTPLVSAQAQKHVTVNEALARIDAAVQLSVRERDRADPPAAPADGDRYLLPAAPSGAWSGQGGAVAAWDAAAAGWLFLDPRPGWRLWVEDEGVLCVLADGGWQVVGGNGGGATSLNPVAGGLLGVNATADATNRLTVKTEAALLSHDDGTAGSGDMRLTLNKAASADDTSLTLQSGYETRAQMGLTGDDDFRIKVSPDGITFHEGLVIDRQDGRTRFEGIMVGNPDRANVYTLTAQPIPNNAETVLSYATASYDTNGFHAAAQPSRLTVPEAGGYRLQAYVQVGAVSANAYLIIHHKNAGGSDASGPYIANMASRYNTLVTPLIEASAGDYFRVSCFQASGGATALVAPDARNYFSIERVF